MGGTKEGVNTPLLKLWQSYFSKHILGSFNCLYERAPALCNGAHHPETIPGSKMNNALILHSM